MALNKFMHPRNRYKKEKPSFLNLAIKYPEFRAQVTQDESGKVLLDFKNADALRALSKCLLKEDFGLTVDLPSNRLVPTLPLRLNYIHWIEDIVGQEEGKWGIDIGTGSSCIYPLLAAKVNKWKYLATEADDENFFHAQKNVDNNGLSGLISVHKVTTEDALLSPLESLPPSFPRQFDFCMCNPPFFADHMEAQAITTSRSVDRPEASSVSTASPEECISSGGEVGFVRQMIEESTVLRDRVRVYTSMVGKKSSLAKLKEELRHQKVTKYSTTEFCQGKTMRWGVAWTFDDTVVFPRSMFEDRKEKPPLQMVVPKGAGGVAYEVHAVAGFIKDLMQALKIHVFQGKKAKAYTSLTLTAASNTWTNMRRQRRQMQRQKGAEPVGPDGQEVEDPKTGGGSTVNDTTQDKAGGVSTVSGATLDKAGITSVVKTKTSLMMPRQIKPKDKKKQVQTVKKAEVDPNPALSKTDNVSVGEKRTLEADDSEEGAESKKPKVDSSEGAGLNDGSMSETKDSRENKTDSKVTSSKSNTPSSTLDNKTDNTLDDTASAPDITVADTSPKDYILKCVLRLKRSDKEHVNLELDWLGGQGREVMHQLFTFLKNKLTPKS